jgi:hypothetical protein
VAYLEASQLVFDNDSRTRFRLVLAAEHTPELQQLAPNWLRLEPSVSSAMFIVRETFGNRELETAMTVTICRLEPGQHSPTVTDNTTTSTSTDTGTDTSAITTLPVVPSSLTAEQLCRGLQSTTLLVAGASAMFAKWARDFQSHRNSLPLFDQQRSDQAGGDPNIRYFHSYWSVPPGMALVISFSPPVPCQSWNFQLNNHWMESLDYRYHKVHTNSVLATPDSPFSPDTSTDTTGMGSGAGAGAGEVPPVSFTLVVTHEERRGGGGNWLTTAGHDCGTM